MKLRAVGGEVRAAVGKDEGVGSPGVGGADAEGIGGGGAYVPRGVQGEQLVRLDCLGAVGVVAAEGLVHVTIEDDGLIRTIQSLLNLVDVTRHHTIQDKRSPARRNLKVHVQVGRRGRKPMARRRRQLRHAAHPLRWPKRELCVAKWWRRLRKRGTQRCATAAGEVQPGLDKDYRDIELVALLDGNGQNFAEEVVVIFEGRGTG